jgi:hypothetical protein
MQSTLATPIKDRAAGSATTMVDSGSPNDCELDGDRDVQGGSTKPAGSVEFTTGLDEPE